MTDLAPLDVWIEGYLDYLADVSRKAAGTVRDVRCSLRRVLRFMNGHRPGSCLWELPLSDYLAWVQHERQAQTSPQSVAKYLSHVRGLLDYAWRCGRAQRKGTPLRNIDVCQVVRRAVERAGLNPNVTPKVLRHSYVTHLMDRGVDLAVIASLMGHRSPHETGVYLHVLGDQSQKAVEQLPGDKPARETP